MLRPMIPEFDFIARYLAPLASGHEALGLADDAALFRPAPGHELVLTQDAMTAEVHFFAGDPPGDIARRLLRANLSDLAAMGAEPRGYLLSLFLPEHTPEEWLAGFTAGLRQDQNIYGLTLWGGDTVATHSPLSLSLTAIGQLPSGTALRRGGAAAGDTVYVSGTIGDSYLGLQSRLGTLPDLPPADRVFLERAYALPNPSPALGIALRGLATSCIDLSDGLIADGRHLARTSGVALELEAVRLPLSPAAARWCGEDLEKRALLAGGGEDFTLLFTLPPAQEDALHRATDALTAPPRLTRIGQIAAHEPGAVRLLDAAGRHLPLPRPGYEHFGR